jgi:hypothetical protein
MKTFLKGLALLAAITSVLWIVVIWRWQATHHDIGTDDVIVYLVLLPLVLFAFAVGLRWAVGTALAKQAAAEGTPPAARGSASAADPDQARVTAAEAQERNLAWPVLGAWVTGPAGDDMGSILDAAKAGKPRPAPDASLRDVEGQPILCARANGVASQPIESAWRTWREAQGGAADALVDSGVARALAALEPVLQQAASAVSEWAQALPEDKRRVACVRVLASWPSGWDEADLAWARAWLDRQAQDHSSPEHVAQRWLVQNLPAGSGPQAWQHADALLLTLQREECDDLVLLLACHSDVSTHAVDVLHREHKLFSAERRPEGHMPGEGAAAVLLARSGPMELAGTREALAWLHRPACSRRDKSIDAPGKTSADIAASVVADAITVAGVDAAELAALCCDADRHSARATELFATTVELLPHLDAVEEMRLVGVALGHTRQTGALWAVAGAIKQAVDAERPAIALSLADEHWRMALIARHQPAAAAMAPIPTS